jgi:hypothetical protein
MPSSTPIPISVIGGVVGGIAALLILGAIIAFIVLRGRRRARAGENRPEHYANFDTNMLTTPPDHNHYAVLTPSEVGNGPTSSQ